MSRGLDIVADYDRFYEEAYYAWNSFYPLAARDMRFYLGDQWEEKDKQKLFQEGRSAFVFNRVRRNINLLTGYQRKNRLSSVVVPMEDSDQATADQLTQVLLHVMNANDGYQVISDCFGGALKTGWNLLSLWKDYRDDPVDGSIIMGRTPYSGFITDPYFTRLDWSDCSYILKRKYLFADQAASLLPGQEKDVYKIHELGWSRDDKFKWLPYQRQPNGQDLVAFNEAYYQKWKPVNMLVDMQTGEYFEWEGDNERLKIMQMMHPSLELVKKSKRYIEKHIIVNGQYMRTEINPHGLDEYPDVPFVGQFDSESEFWEMKIQSLVRCQIDPQKEANRRRSQMIDILDSQINSGYYADEGSVVNPRSLFQTSQGKVIWRKADSRPGAVEKIQPAQIPPSMFQLQETFDKDMMEILGVNDAAFGIANSGQESGIMLQLRQGAAIVNCQDIFDNLRYSQKCVSQKILKLIQKWSPAKIKRILNQEPTDQFYEQNFTKYDIAVQEGLLTDSQKQIYFRQLIDLKQLTDAPTSGPITPSMLVDAAPIQGKSTLQKEMQQNEQVQQQQQQQQMMAQQKLQEAQEHALKAKAISDISLSKERFTRAVANMGLEDERASRAVQDRSDAALNQIKAAKEIAGIDLDHLIKALTFVKQMEEFSRVKEEEIKSDDVVLSENAETQQPNNEAQNESI